MLKVKINTHSTECVTISSSREKLKQTFSIHISRVTPHIHLSNMFYSIPDIFMTTHFSVYFSVHTVCK